MKQGSPIDPAVPQENAAATQRPDTFVNTEIQEVAAEALKVLETKPLAPDLKNTAPISQFHPDMSAATTAVPAASKVAFQRDIGPAIDGAILALDSLEMEAPAKTLQGGAPQGRGGITAPDRAEVSQEQGGITPPKEAAPNTIQGVAPQGQGGIAPPKAEAVAPPESIAPPNTILGVAPQGQGGIAPPKAEAVEPPESVAPPKTIPGVAPPAKGGVAPLKAEAVAPPSTGAGPKTIPGVAPPAKGSVSPTGTSSSSFLTGGAPKESAPAMAKPAAPAAPRGSAPSARPVAANP